MELYIYNGLTDEHIEREYTAEERAIREKEIADAEAAQEAKQAELEAKAIKRAELLDRLGISEEEARILLG